MLQTETLCAVGQAGERRADGLPPGIPFQQQDFSRRITCDGFTGIIVGACELKKTPETTPGDQPDVTLLKLYLFS